MRKYPWVKETKREIIKDQKYCLYNSYNFLKAARIGIALTLSQKSFEQFNILQKEFDKLKKSIKENDKNFYKT
jgi:hypothetical protein